MKNLSIAICLLLFLSLGCNSSQTPTRSSDIQRASSSRQASVTQATSANQPFDYYLLNLSWSPEFCYSHPNAAECTQHRAFTLHGLWPQNNTGPFIENCSNASGPRDPSVYSDIYPDTGLLRHEWKTHGTCSGLAPDAFFNLARQAVQSIAIPTELTTLDRQISMTPNQILDLFASANPSFPRESLALSCGNNYLTAIEVCMSKTLQPIACGPIRSCRANSVRIVPPQSGAAN
ncbi:MULTISPECIES: ribonuclease T2 [Acidobacteriaceae]|uniref:ribonuclease T2 family protein n=1 Tax=Acidobacteriaceae TaxID=204434 RepID=UPI00131D307E|nr:MULTISPECIES: ribonuclease T2 [Acidobacteriaceae]MDW5267148.1 ribonuclease T2 [Edaphobacter sp.]